MEKKTKAKKTVKKVVKAPVKAVEIKKTLAQKIDELKEEAKAVMVEHRKELNASSCNIMNKAIMDLNSIYKALNR
jgi:anion-transporting  ArsA/GET3 family ATPase